MSKPPKITYGQKARVNLIDKRKIREIQVSKLKWNLQKIFDQDKER
tara:strand:+ start:16392 stop:16529 length:138 start_codon:yes stop_codon:yes gene_type:complete